MAKIRETEVERDADGRVLVSREHVTEEKPRRKGGFGWGMLLGVLVIAVAIIAFAYNQGSFQQAGVEAMQFRPIESAIVLRFERPQHAEAFGGPTCLSVDVGDETEADAGAPVPTGAQ